MGNGNGSGDITDVDFFKTGRNDVPTQQPNGLQQEVYRDWQPGQPGQPQAPGRIAQGNDNSGYVTIRDGQNIIYAQPGSTVVINENSNGPSRVGDGGQRGYMPDYNDQMRQVQERRQASMQFDNGYRQPYYGPENNAGYHRGPYQNINGGGFEVPQPYRPNPIAQFLGGVSAFLSFGGGHGRYGGGYHQQFRPPFYPQQRGGIQIGIGVQPAWAYNNQSYYGGNNGAYYNAQPQYNQTQYDQYGNPIYSG
jgi:hypothetical protein